MHFYQNSLSAALFWRPSYSQIHRIELYLHYKRLNYSIFVTVLLLRMATKHYIRLKPITLDD